MRRSVGMDVDVSPLPVMGMSRQPARRPGMIEVDMRQQHVGDVVHRQIMRGEGGPQPVEGRTRPALDDQRAFTMLDEI